MNRKLNETNVPELMYQEATEIARAGGKAFLVISDDRGLKPHHCRNCCGVGTVGIQIFTGGPFDATPTIQNNLKNANDPNDVPARATFYNDKWYKQKTRTWDCPTCEGTGIIGGIDRAPVSL